jgi:hypothetical protein
MTNELVEWQRVCPKTGMVQPWLTHGFLDWADQQDWSDKTIIMFGAGLGDAWLAKKCRLLYVVERNTEWLAKAESEVQRHSLNNVKYVYRPCNDCDGKQEYYCQLIEGVDVDIIINDDAYRTEICELAVNYFKGRGGLLIADNFNQDFVWISPTAIEIMEPYKETERVFLQPEHTNHEGRQWNTRYWIIN